MSILPAPDAPAALDPADIDRRIVFHDVQQVLEVDLSDLTLGNSADVNLLYDRLEARIAESGHTRWFFLIDYGGTRIDPGAWFAHARRGKDLNLAHSMATVRFDTSDETRAQIERSAGTDNFDPNLFADRQDALDHLLAQPSDRTEPVIHEPTITADDIRARVKFLDDDAIFDVDFSDLTFEHSVDVDICYDVLEEVLGRSGRKWYFLVNYEGTRIFSGAWIRYAQRGKALNEAFSLGSVRYAPGSETETDIRLRAETGGFRPNIRNTRDEALLRIDEMKAGADD